MEVLKRETMQGEFGGGEVLSGEAEGDAGVGQVDLAGGEREDRLDEFGTDLVEKAQAEREV